MELHGVDLNLLKIFDAVYAERSVSRAALRIGLTQPSVSHGLTRLRLLFSDPLFVRHQSGMAPTVVADRVAAALGPALRDLQAMLDEHLQFDPRRSTRTLRVYWPPCSHSGPRDDPCPTRPPPRCCSTACSGSASNTCSPTSAATIRPCSKPSNRHACKAARCRA